MGERLARSGLTRENFLFLVLQALIAGLFLYASVGNLVGFIHGKPGSPSVSNSESISLGLWSIAAIAAPIGIYTRRSWGYFLESLVVGAFSVALLDNWHIFEERGWRPFDWYLFGLLFGYLYCVGSLEVSLWKRGLVIKRALQRTNVSQGSEAAS
jgi:hypothetical protein